MTSFSPQGILHFKVGSCSPSGCLNLALHAVCKPIIDTEHVSQIFLQIVALHAMHHGCFKSGECKCPLLHLNNTLQK